MLNFAFLDIRVIIDYMCRVDATEGGKNAILALADGDLRRVLNLLQSTAMAYPQVLRARDVDVNRPWLCWCFSIVWTRHEIISRSAVAT